MLQDCIVDGYRALVGLEQLWRAAWSLSASPSASLGSANLGEGHLSSAKPADSSSCLMVTSTGFAVDVAFFSTSRRGFGWTGTSCLAACWPLEVRATEFLSLVSLARI